MSYRIGSMNNVLSGVCCSVAVLCVVSCAPLAACQAKSKKLSFPRSAILPNNNPPQLQCRLALGSWRGAPRVGVGAGMWPELPPELLHHIIRCGQASGLDFVDCLAAVCTCAAWQQALQPLARAEKIGWLRLEKPTARIRALFLALAADAFPQLRSLRLLSADGVDYRLHVQWLRREAVRSRQLLDPLDISAHLKPARLNKDALAVRTIAMFAASACAVPGSQVAQIKLGPTWGFDGLYGTVDLPCNPNPSPNPNPEP